MGGGFSKLDRQFKSYVDLKIKKLLEIRTSYMGALLLQQRKLWEKSVYPGVTSKSI